MNIINQISKFNSIIFKLKLQDSIQTEDQKHIGSSQKRRQCITLRLYLISIILIILPEFLMNTPAYGQTYRQGKKTIEIGSKTPTDTLKNSSEQGFSKLPLDQQVQSLAYTVDHLTNKVEAELEASKMRMEAMKERADWSLVLFAFLAEIGSFLGVTSWLKERQEHREYEHERKFYEERAQKYEKGYDEERKAILKLYNGQIEANDTVNKHDKVMFRLQETNLEKVNKITTAIADGAAKNVEYLNNMLSSFKEIMGFKVAEAEDTKRLMSQMRHQLEELEEAHREQVEDLLHSAIQLRRSRFLYTNPDPDFQRQMVEFRTKMDLMQRVVLDRYTGVKTPKAENRRYGELYLRRGVIAYYNNDIIKSQEMLKMAEHFFPYSEQEINNMPRDLRMPTAFIQFYLALIEKNYGGLAAAREYIEKSYMVYGQNEQDELLTPTTRAEIFSYQEDKNAEAAIKDVLDRANKLQQREPLKRHDAIYALRSRLLLGNTYYVIRKWDQALAHYEDALKTDQRQDYSYYSYHSIAQVFHQLGRVDEAKANKQHAYDELIKSDHLRTKVALDTRILLNALAYICTREEMPEQAKKYKEAIRELWPRIQKINGFELRLFSLEKKRQVSKEDFWTEIFGY